MSIKCVLYVRNELEIENTFDKTELILGKPSGAGISRYEFPTCLSVLQDFESIRIKILPHPKLRFNGLQS